MGIENQLLIASLSVYIGLLLSSFFTALTRDIVLPLLTPIAPAEDGVSKWIIQVATVKINIGDAIVQVVNLAVAMGVVYATLPYIKEYVAVAGRR
jgi:hypothetical protein